MERNIMSVSFFSTMAGSSVWVQNPENIFFSLVLYINKKHNK